MGRRQLEFIEELGCVLRGPAVTRGAKQSSAKSTSIWARRPILGRARCQQSGSRCSGPPRSGVLAEFPEVDLAGWVPPVAGQDQNI